MIPMFWGGGGGSICLGPLPQPLLLTTNNQALLLKGSRGPKSPPEKTQDPWRLAPILFYSNCRTPSLSGHFEKWNTSISEFFFFFFPSRKRPWVKKHGVLWGPLQVLFFGKTLGQKVRCPSRSSSSTILGSLWISPNWPGAGEITRNFLAVGWCKKSTAKQFFKKNTNPLIPFLHIFPNSRTSKSNSLCMLHTSQCSKL